MSNVSSSVELKLEASEKEILEKAFDLIKTITKDVNNSGTDIFYSGEDMAYVLFEEYNSNGKLPTVVNIYE